MPDLLEEILTELKVRREAYPEPPFEVLEAYVAGRLPADQVEVMETTLLLRPELRSEVEAMRNPDPGLLAAFRRGLEKAGK